MVDFARDAQLSGRTPWHLWAVGVVAVLFNGFGVFDYVMSKTRGAAYLESAGMSADQVEHYMALPFWMNCVWAIGVWGAIAASILLLLRNRLAAPIFPISLAAFLLSLLYHYVLSGAAAMMGTAGTVSSAVIALMLTLFLLYSQAMAKRGFLR